MQKQVQVSQTVFSWSGLIKLSMKNNKFKAFLFFRIKFGLIRKICNFLQRNFGNKTEKKSMLTQHCWVYAVNDVWLQVLRCLLELKCSLIYYAVRMNWFTLLGFQLSHICRLQLYVRCQCICLSSPPTHIANSIESEVSISSSTRI